MNNQPATMKNGRGGTRMKNPLKPPRFSKNNNGGNSITGLLMKTWSHTTKIKRE